MIGPVRTADLSLPPVCREEVYRYAGAAEGSAALERLVNDVLPEAESQLSARVCFREFPLCWQEGTLVLGAIPISSADLTWRLTGCHHAVVFAATIGFGLDRLIARYSRIAPSRALILQALGTERIEALGDIFCQQLDEEYASQNARPRPRFSPGYGDLPLGFQQELFSLLDCTQKIGLTLNESLIMSPSKSITAIVGIGPDCLGHSPAGCCLCPKTDCIYRRHP